MSWYFRQILLTSSITNVWRTVKRMCINYVLYIVSGFKGISARKNKTLVLGTKRLPHFCMQSCRRPIEHNVGTPKEFCKCLNTIINYLFNWQDATFCSSQFVPVQSTVVKNVFLLIRILIRWSVLVRESSWSLTDSDLPRVSTCTCREWFFWELTPISSYNPTEGDGRGCGSSSGATGCCTMKPCHWQQAHPFSSSNCCSPVFTFFCPGFPLLYIWSYQTAFCLQWYKLHVYTIPLLIPLITMLNCFKCDKNKNANLWWLQIPVEFHREATGRLIMTPLSIC